MKTFYKRRTNIHGINWDAVVYLRIILHILLISSRKYSNTFFIFHFDKFQFFVLRMTDLKNWIYQLYNAYNVRALHYFTEKMSLHFLIGQFILQTCVFWWEIVTITFEKYARVLHAKHFENIRRVHLWPQLTGKSNTSTQFWVVCKSIRIGKNFYWLLLIFIAMNSHWTIIEFKYQYMYNNMTGLFFRVSNLCNLIACNL